MKQILFFITLMLTQLCYSQTEQSVFGINPNTTIKKYNSALATKGYKPTKTAEGLYSYKVKYAGYPNCDMEVKFNSGNDSIRLVTIYFPHESVAKDEAIFRNMTQQFKEKYGNESDWNDGILGAVFKTQKMKSYGNAKVGISYVVWYFNDEKEEDGVHVQYSTKAKSDGKIQVSSDI